MKKFVVLSVLTSLLMPSSVVFADTNITNDDVIVPKWEEYVPDKYKEPRMFSKGKSIAELSTGIVLIDTIIACPIGIPMTVHATTKLKNTGYYNKKIKFDEGLAAAEEIQDPEERQQFYNNLIKECKFNPKFKAQHDKKVIKQAKKEAKQAEKEAKKAEKSKL